MKDPTIRIFWLALLAYVIAWTVLCWLTQPNLPLDMVEMIYWGEQWQWGYHKHPPLPAWIAASVWNLSGHQPIFMYLTAQLTIAATFWAVWQMAREGLSPWLALCAVGVLQGCYYCTYSINDINNTIVTRPFWCLTVLFLYRATKPDSNRPLLYWALTGVMIGLGMLSKYYLGVLVISMMAIPLLLPQARAHLRTAGPWVMAAISLVIFAPHLMWMFHTDFQTIAYALERSSESSASGSWLSHLTAPLDFLLTQTGAWTPILLITMPALSLAAIWKTTTSLHRPSDHTYFRKYLLIVVAGPILFYLSVAALTGAGLRSMWGGPLFCFFGVLLIELSKNAKVQLAETPAIGLVLRNCLVAATVMWLGLFVRNGLGPLVRDDFSRIHFPGQAVSEEVHRRWKDEVDQPLQMVGGSMFEAGCVGIYSNSQVDVFAKASLINNPWIDEATVHRQGGMFVWDIDEEGPTPPSDWPTQFPNAEILEPFACPAGGLASDRMANIGMLIVRPRR